MMTYAMQQRSSPRKLVGFAAVIVLHVFLVWVIVNGTAHKVVEAVRQPMMAKIIAETRPPELPPPPPPPPKVVAPPPPFIPLPEIQVRQPPPTPHAPTQVTNVRPAEPSPPSPPAPAVQATPHEAVRVAPVVAASACRRPEYPSLSRRMEESGTVVLSFLIGIDGRVLDSKIAQSSGHSRLDEAAREALSLCAFKPGTVDGKAEQAWAQIRYTWSLD